MMYRRVVLGDLIAPAKVRRAGDETFPILSMTMHHGLVDQESKFKKRVASADLSQYKVISRDQLVVGFPIDEGVLGFQDLYDEAIVSPAYGVWDVIRPESIDRRYLQSFLRSPEALTYFRSRLRGTTARRRSLPNRSFLELSVPVPTLNEQRRVLKILDHADTLRAKRREAVTRLNELTQSIFIDMFGDPVANPRGFRAVPLTQLGHLYSGGTPSKSSREYWEGSLPWFSPKDLKRDDLFDSQDHISELVPERTSLRLLPADTVVFVVRGMILAHSFPVSVLRVPATINQDMKAVLPSVEITSNYLATCLRVQRQHVLAAVSTAAHGTKRLDLEGMDRVQIPLPPIELQHRFDETLAEIRRLKSVQEAAGNQTEELFFSLQFRAFRDGL